MNIYLQCEYNNNSIQILSCEQIVGNHVKAFDTEEEFKDKIRELSQKLPKQYQVKANKKFIVSGPNSQDLTLNANGKSLWCLIKCTKDPIKKTSFLLMGGKLWGIEFGSGLRMKKSMEKYGKDTVVEYLRNQIRSIIEKPEEWPGGVEAFFRL